MSKIHTIYEALLNRKGEVCSKSEIVEVIQEYNRLLGKINLPYACWYLSRHGYIKRIIFNFYYVNSVDERERNFCKYEDKELLFRVLNRLNLPWYVGLHSALYLQGKIWQIPNTLTIVNQRFSGKKIVLGLKIRFIKIKENLMFGLKEGKTRHNILYHYSDLAKTYLDLSYFRESPKLVSLKDTKEYLQKYPPWLQRLI